MMKFRCPHCQKLLETDEAAGKFLCPICKKWSRLPVPKKKAAVEEEEILEVVAASPQPRRERREAITEHNPDERRPRRRDEEDEEPVELDVVEEGEDGPRRRSAARGQGVAARAAVSVSIRSTSR